MLKGLAQGIAAVVSSPGQLPLRLLTIHANPIQPRQTPAAISHRLHIQLLNLSNMSVLPNSPVNAELRQPVLQHLPYHLRDADYERVISVKTDIQITFEQAEPGKWDSIACSKDKGEARDTGKKSTSRSWSTCSSNASEEQINSSTDSSAQQSS
ncbi:uncharacterized protein K452DRAFT_287546 [Aplosporella prunicola CBS 121167]|uniref:Uncharacterized protein n=1 Tax=Aplosporella prunicola CBS 121167 TaxID=1176127 RepID=A0A6A6BBU4_9PEZI|nr:uncharacterized protein K452DRAFT_287546 [Aplosporella prunicola CBS 121167]KAF2141590.1 hypothetical protein K452DRAFT_287546 [Aplosporella prunicola CBS 121167]